MKKIAATILALLIGTPAIAAETAEAIKRVDLNTATFEQLKTTLGVDDAEAQRIIEGRPYAKKEDLKEKKVMTADDYEKLKKLIESVC
jgi:competence protein ComEA